MSVLKKGKDAIRALNAGGKVVMPPSVLEWMMATMSSSSPSTNQQPLLFCLTNNDSGKQTHAGVIEFTAEEGRIYLPDWMLGALKANQGDILSLTNASLPKGSFVKLQPLSLDFLDITDPRAVLENTMRHFSALTCGDVVSIDYNDTIYQVLVLETKSSQASSDPTAISIFETDLEVDFAPPPGYKEPKRVEKSISAALKSDNTVPSGLGPGRKLYDATTITENKSIDPTIVTPLELSPSKLFFGHHRKHGNVSDVNQPEQGTVSPHTTGRSLRE
jgi:ubiquitin fusion degradation protein 1